MLEVELWSVYLCVINSSLFGIEQDYCRICIISSDSILKIAVWSTRMLKSLNFAVVEDSQIPIGL